MSREPIGLSQADEFFQAIQRTALGGYEVFHLDLQASVENAFLADEVRRLLLRGRMFLKDGTTETQSAQVILGEKWVVTAGQASLVWRIMAESLRSDLLYDWDTLCACKRENEEGDALWILVHIEALSIMQMKRFLDWRGGGSSRIAPRIGYQEDWRNNPDPILTTAPVRGYYLIDLKSSSTPKMRGRGPLHAMWNGRIVVAPIAIVVQALCSLWLLHGFRSWVKHDSVETVTTTGGLSDSVVVLVPGREDDLIYLAAPWEMVQQPKSREVVTMLLPDKKK